MSKKATCIKEVAMLMTNRSTFQRVGDVLLPLMTSKDQAVIQFGACDASNLIVLCARNHKSEVVEALAEVHGLREENITVMEIY